MGPPHDCDFALLLGVLGPSNRAPDVRRQRRETNHVIALDCGLHVRIGADALIVQLYGDVLSLEHGAQVPDTQDHGQRIFLNVRFDVGYESFSHRRKSQ